eukprot:GSChrysophyteH1.ASY1.ANO1.3078.1 assembled CDS
MSEFGENARLYLEDTYLFESSAEVLLHESHEDGSGFVILDRTCFSPQGGGQPTDEGEISIDGVSSTFTVKMVKVNGEQIVHNGFADAAFWNILKERGNGSTTVHLKVNERLRRIYARLHSAGHALDKAMGAIGYGDRLVGVKGYHFLDGPNVEYILKGEALSKDELAELPGLLTAEMRRLVEEDIPTVVRNIPKKDTIRMVSLCGMYIPCGGTHIKSSGEIGTEVEVTKVKKKKNMYRVSYGISLPAE